MPRTLTAADRSALIRLASTMEKGSPERKAILAGLDKVAEDHVAFNDSLKKLLKGLKRDTGAKKIKQTYKGKGGEAARSQQLVEWSGATLGIWPDKGFVSLRGPRTSREVYNADGKWLKTDRTPPATDRIDYGSKTPEAVYKEIVKALSEWLPKGKTAGLEKSASPLMGIQQIIGKLVNDRTLKAHRPTQVITKNPPQGQITLHGIRDNLTITVAQNKDGLGYFAVGKKDGKAHVFVSSRRPIPLGGAIQKVTRPILEAVREWEAGQGSLFKVGASKEEKYVQLFRDLAGKRRKTLQIDLKGVMGGSTNGPRKFKRGRMGRPKRWRGGRKGPFERVSLSIVPLDDMGNPIKMRSGYKLWLSEYDDGTADVSASIGDMAIMINDMKA